MATKKSKIKPATPETAYSETVKAVRLIERLEKEKEQEVPADERLRMVDRALETARTRQDAERLYNEKKELELLIKYPQWEQLNFPEDKQEIVRENYRTETEQANEFLTDLYTQLEKVADTLAEAVPLLQAADKVERKKRTASVVEIILNNEVEVLPGHPQPAGSLFRRIGGDPMYHSDPHAKQAAKFSAKLKVLARAGQRKAKGDR